MRAHSEEDNDDAIPIVDLETTRPRELYGDYYISEMIRHPDGCRQLIIGEDADGAAAGVMFLSSAIDVDLLNENFELAPYRGLRKPSDEATTTDDAEILDPAFSRRRSDDASPAAEAAEDKRSPEEVGRCFTRIRISSFDRSKFDIAVPPRYRASNVIILGDLIKRGANSKDRATRTRRIFRWWTRERR